MFIRSIPDRAVIAALAAVFCLALLIYGYARPGLRVIEKKETEVTLQPDFEMPKGAVPSWVKKPPTKQKVIQDIPMVIRESTAMIGVTSGALVRSENGALEMSPSKSGNARCPT